MKPTLLAFSTLFIAALGMACSEAVQDSGISGGGGGNGGAGGAPIGGGGTGGGTGGDTGETTTGGGGGPCGGISGGICDPSRYCDYTGDTCGVSSGAGSCQPKPEVCTDVIEPVCGCDGKVYNNACEAAAAGIDLQSMGGCPSPDGEFPCGGVFCSKTDQLCQIDKPPDGPGGPLDPGGPVVYTCVPLPPNCQVPDATCACLADMPCAQSCQLASGGFTLTCGG
jgi:hypothetical protein